MENSHARHRTPIVLACIVASLVAVVLMLDRDNRGGRRTNDGSTQDLVFHEDVAEQRPSPFVLRHRSVPGVSWPPTFDAFARSALNALGASNRNMLYSRAVAVMPLEDLFAIVAVEDGLQPSDATDVLRESPQHRGDDGPSPVNFRVNDTLHTLRYLKATSSLALEKLFNDPELARHYASLVAAGPEPDESSMTSARLRAARRGFKRAVESVVLALATQQYSALEFIVAATPRDQRDALMLRRDLIAVNFRDATPAAPRKRIGDDDDEKNDAAAIKAAGRLFPRVTRASSLLALDHWSLDVGNSRSPKGDFWIGLRPHLECSSFGRTSRSPFKSSHQCNPEYITGRRQSRLTGVEETLGEFARSPNGRQRGLRRATRPAQVRVGAFGRVEWPLVRSQVQAFDASAPGRVSLHVGSCEADAPAKLNTFMRQGTALLNFSSFLPECPVGEAESLGAFADRLAGQPALAHAFLRLEGVETAAFSRWLRQDFNRSRLTHRPFAAPPSLLHTYYVVQSHHARWFEEGHAFAQSWMAAVRGLGYAVVAAEPAMPVMSNHFLFASHAYYIISEAWLSVAAVVTHDTPQRGGSTQQHRQSPSTFPGLVDRVLDCLPLRVRNALYDPALFDEVLAAPCKQQRVGTSPRIDTTEPDPVLLSCLLPVATVPINLTSFEYISPQPPAHFASPFAQLRYIKTMLSLGIGRLHRDKHLADQYAALLRSRSSSASALSALEAFEAAVVKIVRGYVKSLEILLHFVVEGTAPNTDQRRALRDIVGLAALAPHRLPRPSIGWGLGANPVDGSAPVPTSGVVRPIDDEDDANTTAVDRPSTLAEFPLGSRAQGRWFTMFAIETDDRVWLSDDARNGLLTQAQAFIDLKGGGFNTQYWQRVLEPRVRCEMTHRTCSSAEGCRRLCNPTYTFYGRGAVTPSGGVTDAQLADVAMSVDSAKLLPPRALHVVGYGSNDEYEWEDGMILVAGGVKADVTERVRALDAPLPSSSSSSSSASATMNVLDTITSFDCTVKTPHFSDKIKRSGVRFGLAPVCVGEATRAEGGVVRQGQLREYLRGEAAGFAAVERTKPPQSAAPGQTAVVADDTFSQLAVLKMDAEGFEHVALPEWVRTEMRNIAKARTTTDFLIDFGAVPGNQVVSQFQLELHRYGHTRDAAAMYWGAAWSHVAMLELAALGFLAVGAERNHMSYCCGEIVAAHYRHIILSESWSQALEQ